MSWLSHAIRQVANHSPAARLSNSAWNAAGMGTSNTLRRALDPGSVQNAAIRNGAPLTGRLLVDPGNEITPRTVADTGPVPMKDPRTGMAGTNARDMIAHQMGNSPTRPPMAGPPMGGPPMGGAPLPPAAVQPQRNFGDIHAIMDYVQGRRAPPVAPSPVAPPIVQPNVPTPGMPRPWMGK